MTFPAFITLIILLGTCIFELLLLFTFEPDTSIHDLVVVFTWALLPYIGALLFLLRNSIRHSVEYHLFTKSIAIGFIGIAAVAALYTGQFFHAAFIPLILGYILQWLLVLFSWGSIPTQNLTSGSSSTR